jgi:ketosteroid isomerase-like protein
MATTTTAVPRETDEFQAQAARWVSDFTEGWRAPKGPEAFVEHFRSRLAADVRLVQPQLPTVVGLRGFEQRFVRPLFELMPDIRGDVERWAAGGDTVYIELTLRGTLGGRSLSWRVCDRVTLRDGVAIERESYFDPGPLIAAIARTPRAWPKFTRFQASSLAARISERRKS